jgi:hypothetical protein
MLKKILLTLSSVAGFLAFAAGAHAAVLENAFVTLSDPRSANASTHTITFTAINANLGRVAFQHCITPSGTCGNVASYAPTGIGTVEVDDVAENSWTFSFAAGTDTVTVVRDAVDADADNSKYEFPITGQTNPAYTECNHTSTSTTGSCYYRIQTYATTDTSTTADSNTIAVTYTQAVTVSATVDPTFTLQITGTAGTGQTVNGSVLTSGITTTTTTIPFGNLTADTEKFASMRVMVTSNNVGGYSITNRLVANMAGSAYGSDIDPFAGAGVTSTNAVAWSAPTGTQSGSNSGWLGVGSSDTTVTGAASNEFFPLGTTAQTVASATGPASSRVSDLVYGIEVNAYQQADSYSGTMLFTSTSTF